MPIHLGDRDIKFSPNYVLLGLAIGTSMVAVLYWLEPKSAAYELCKEVAQTTYEQCSSDAAIHNDDLLNLSLRDCNLKREQDLLACY